MGSSALPEIETLVDRVRLKYDDECFACGRGNPMGLHLDNFSQEQSEISAEFTPRAEFRGTPTTLHGGIAATALDEMAVWAAILTHKVMAVTGTLDLRYQQPATMGQTFLVTARVDERRGRRLRCSSELVTSDGSIVTRASGLYLVTEDISALLV